MPEETPKPVPPQVDPDLAALGTAMNVALEHCPPNTKNLVIQIAQQAVTNLERRLSTPSTKPPAAGP